MYALLHAGVDVFVEHHCVLPLQERAEQRQIGEIPAAKKERALAAKKMRCGFLQAGMGLRVSAQQARCPRARRIVIERMPGGGAQRGMRGEPKIIIRGEIDSTWQRK